MIEHKVSGTVYGVVLNDHISLKKIGMQTLTAAPYKAVPQAPAMYIKPANTHLACGATVCLPGGAETVEVGATVGLVMKYSASRLSPDNAIEAVGGIVLAADLSLPHDSYYRPAIREKCFDGALPISTIRPLVDLAGLELRTEINGEAVEQYSLTDLVRDPAQLLSDVSEFMTLAAGDVLLVGVRYQAARAAMGSVVEISAKGVGRLGFSVTGAQV